MGGIFISYRRVDTMPWAGRLFDTLCRHFERRDIFMDINGGIPRGARFDTTLDDSIANCDVLLALIGPSWLTCVTADGQRRLDSADDWVRKEIARSLGRGVPVVPVLLGNASFPGPADLPDDLKPLCTRQQAVLSDADWHDHAAQLMSDIVRTTPLKLVRALTRNDTASAGSGIQLLSLLVADNPRVGEAVARSREVVENTYRRIVRLDAYKAVHDALHTIEFMCLRPLEMGGSVPLRPFRSRFTTEANRIRAIVDSGSINPALSADVADGLAMTDAAFELAVAQPSDSSVEQVIVELNALLFSLPPKLDVGISDAMRDLDLDRLLALMDSVRNVLPSSAEDPTVAKLDESIAALGRLRAELGQRVQEHAQLQRLDAKLRAVCVAGVATGMLAAEWKRIKVIRARLGDVPSPELQAARADMQAVESNVDSRLAAADEAVAFAGVQEYFRLVADAFRNVDRALKAFCGQLSDVSRPLKTILDLC